MKVRSPIGKIKQYLKRNYESQLIRSSGLFDRGWYLENNPDVAQAGLDPLWHYLTVGAFEGRDPSPRFNSRWYLEANEDVRKTGVNPLLHYLKRGRQEGRKPLPPEGIQFEDEKANQELVRASGMFDEASYLKNNPDVAKTNMDPLVHYLRYGGREGRDLAPHFYSQSYLDAYPDVKEAGINPLVHYLKYGQKEGRQKNPLVFELRRVYDYSRETNRIVYEEAPERIYLERPHVIGNFSGTLQEGEALCPPAYVSVLENVIITGGESPVMTRDNLVLSDELTDFGGSDFGKKTARIKTIHEGVLTFRTNQKPELSVPEGVFLSCGHDDNYFHWLVECLPKLLLMDSLEEFKDVPLLVTGGLHKNLMDALHRLNVNRRELIFIEPGSPCQVERLIFPSPLSRIVDRYGGSLIFNQDIVLSHKWVAEVSRHLTENSETHKKPWRKIYLARRKGRRLLENQEPLEHRLLAEGFEVIELEGVSLDFQIKLFSEAVMVVAPTGAALTNMLFCPPGTRVIIFMSNHELTNFYFWSNLGAVTGLDVTTIVGQRVFKVTSQVAVHDHYVIDTDLVLEEIKKHEQASRN